MGVVYSTLLANERNSGNFTVYPPDGYLWVVRCVMVFNGGAIPAFDTLFMATSGAVWFSVSYDAVEPLWTPVQDIHVVVPPGEGISGTVSDDQAADWIISGYQLSLP
jgi:hypothetical protein